MNTEAFQFSGEEQKLLYRVARRLLRTGDYGELLTELLDDTIQALGADRGCIVIRDGTQFRATVARNFRNDALVEAEQEVSSSIATKAVTEGCVLLIDDALRSEQFRDRASVRRLGLHSVLCAPLVASNEAFALIYLENRDISNRFTDGHRRLLGEICSLASPRLHVAIAVEQVRKRARELECLMGDSDGIFTADAEMARVLRSVAQIAPTELPILLQGETGTGKELFARAIYRRSARANGPFIVLNCAAIPATLIESELFGYVRGAFTGAVRDRVGLIGAAHRGTLFLDEIGELPPESQPRLLRVLQSGDFTRLGSVQSETADVRVIAATNRDLDGEVKEGRFRNDLYFRLSTVTLKIPPLRERPHDIHLLADHFLRLYAGRYGRQTPALSSECLAVLSSYPFPGNVRELEGEMARLAALYPAGEPISASELSERFSKSPKTAKVKSSELTQPMSLLEMERKLISCVLEYTGGNRSRAAEILGISREGLRVKMQRFGTSEAVTEADP